MQAQTGSVSHISVQLDADARAAGRAREALLGIEQDVDPELMGDVRLLVTELVTNGVRHSRAGSAEHVELDVAVDRGTIRVEVRDRGAGFEPQPRRPGQSKAGGWGLYLVERLTDRWGVICNHATRVWFEIDLRGASGAGRA